jgi:hypothetical protein
MADASQVQNLTGLLETLEDAGDGDTPVSIADIRDQLGVRSFGPFLLIVGLFLAGLYLLMERACRKTSRACIRGVSAWHSIAWRETGPVAAASCSGKSRRP